jgi:hypothetical protein
MPPKLLLLSIPLADFAGREVTATVSSDKPPQLILTMSMGSVKLPAEEPDRLVAWWQAWREQRR